MLIADRKGEFIVSSKEKSGEALIMRIELKIW